MLGADDLLLFDYSLPYISQWWFLLKIRKLRLETILATLACDWSVWRMKINQPISYLWLETGFLSICNTFLSHVAYQWPPPSNILLWLGLHLSALRPVFPKEHIFHLQRALLNGFSSVIKIYGFYFILAEIAIKIFF